MKKRFLIVLILIAAMIYGCAGMKAKTVTGYEALGITIKEIRDTASNMCDEGKLREKDCQEIRALYNKARLTYISAGDMLIIYLNAEDAVKKQKTYEAYQSLINDANKLAFELIDLAIKLGIKEGSW